MEALKKQGLETEAEFLIPANEFRLAKDSSPGEEKP
jgi:hypothetical protein